MDNLPRSLSLEHQGDIQELIKKAEAYLAKLGPGGNDRFLSLARSVIELPIMVDGEPKKYLEGRKRKAFINKIKQPFGFDEEPDSDSDASYYSDSESVDYQEPPALKAEDESAQSFNIKLEAETGEETFAAPIVIEVLKAKIELKSSPKTVKEEPVAIIQEANEPMESNEVG